MTAIIEEFIRELDLTESVFELIELSYRVLEREITNQSNFISEYMEKSPLGNDNPNKDRLNGLHQRVVELFAEYSSVKYLERRQKVKELLGNMVLVRYGEPIQNELTIVYRLLLAIDCAADGWDKIRITSKWGPLNGRGGVYAVYFWDIQPYMEEVKEYIGRKQAHGGGFFAFIRNFRFINRNKWLVKESMPEVYAWKAGRVEANTLKVASILPGKKQTIEFVPVKGTLFGVSYQETEQKELADNIIFQMDKAVEEGVNIIILPEFIISKDILSQISSQLYLWKRKNLGKISELIAVFAGSTMDNPVGDNIMYILDSWGNTIGQYYKYSPYRKERKDNAGYALCERLAHPGEKCTVLFVQGIGAFLPAICRDVIDDNYTAALVKNFMPMFLLVSAWSKSVQSFNKYFVEFAEKYYVNSVLCNACDAVDNGYRNAPVGMVCTVEKPKTVAQGNCHPCRREGCKRACKRGCCFMVSYNFSQKALSVKESVWIERKNYVEEFM